jgi:hypothetical protein
MRRLGNGVTVIIIIPSRRESAIKVPPKGAPVCGRGVRVSQVSTTRSPAVAQDKDWSLPRNRELTSHAGRGEETPPPTSDPKARGRPLVPSQSCGLIPTANELWVCTIQYLRTRAAWTEVMTGRCPYGTHCSAPHCNLRPCQPSLREWPTNDLTDGRALTLRRPIAALHQPPINLVRAAATGHCG